MLRRKTRAWAYVAFLLLSLGFLTVRAAFAAAEVETGVSDFRITATDHVIFSNSKDPSDTVAPTTNLFMNEALVRGEVGAYSLDIDFTNRFTTNGPQAVNKPFVLEKKTLAADWTDWQVKVGDSHHELGRGIALALYRDNTFGVDNTLEGGVVRYHPQGFDAMVFGGRIRALEAPVAINPIPNPLLRRNVWLGGGSLGGQLAADTKASAHYFSAFNQPNDTNQINRRWHTVGATFTQDALFDTVDLYLESNTVFAQQLLSGDFVNQAQAYGSFASVVWSPLPWKLKLEGKDYRKYDFEFRRPPSLEDDVVVNVTTVDVSAAKATLEHRFDDGKDLVFGSFLEGDDRSEKSTLHHAVVGTKFKSFARTEWEVRAGYRWLPGVGDITHGLLKFRIPTFKGEALELGARKQFGLLNRQLATREDRNIFDLTYTFSEQINATLGYEYVPSNDPDTGRHFINAGGTYKTGGLVTKAFIGQTSGGSVCSGGVCRQVPPYSGAMLEASYTF